MTTLPAEEEAVLEIRLTKLSSDRHRFALTRPDGSSEGLELVTREFLFHDLLHFAVETEAGLANAFYGLLAKRATYADLSGPGVALSGEALTTERIVGVLTGANKAPEMVPQATVTAARTYFAAYDEQPPAWFTAAFVEAVRERMRRLLGQWKAVPFGGTMTIVFRVGDKR